ncbi:hypothetical protein M378DRAFT_26228 [Amanita muscaria Koide BX008]|uniref:Uncharacterized protein n=1 Tax=Amanita muscaria (strain Koide BX008) TaxID=946122 RepID=A0A0C2WXQ2_AMAMK|nr:hypothetical protein M378DRAFT_26228 [Amanita muscaria Koide BX008]
MTSPRTIEPNLQATQASILHIVSKSTWSPLAAWHSDTTTIIMRHDLRHGGGTGSHLSESTHSTSNDITAENSTTETNLQVSDSGRQASSRSNRFAGLLGLGHGSTPPPPPGSAMALPVPPSKEEEL